MKSNNFQAAMLVVCLFLTPAVWAQVPAPENQSAAPPTQRVSAAEVPRLIKYSGTLLDAQEHPVAAPVGLTFALYAQQSGGAALWVETQNVKPDANGNYTVLLGANSASGVPTELFASGEARWLGIQVGQQPEHERILLVSVPYALKAGDAETLGGLPASAFVTTGTPANTAHAGGTAPLAKSQMQSTPKKTLTTPQPATPCSSVTSDGAAAVNSIALFTTACNVEGSVITQSGANVGIGTATPAVAVDVVGNNAGLRLSGTGTHEVTVTGASSGRLGEDATGFFFSSDTNGKVVKFLTNNGTLNEWMRITSAGNVGIGTTTPGSRLEVDANAATQVMQVSQAGNGNGISATTASSPSAAGALQGALVGTATGTPTGTAHVGGVAGFYTGSGLGAGVFGQATTVQGAGGVFNNTTGSAALIVLDSALTSSVFEVDSAGTINIHGNTNMNGALTLGPGGSSPATINTIANGINLNAMGPMTMTAASFALNPPTGSPGLVNITGALNVSGNISKGGGSFKIDHPLDPASKYLYHSFVESPDMMNIYNGVVVLDGHGRAWVALPDWFEALNSDFRYQLTSIGLPQPKLYVAKEVAGNQFQIAGGKPHGKVSWQVTGIRHDAFANAHRIPVEEQKKGEEAGKYLYPELFGQPESLRVGAAQSTHRVSEENASSVNQK